MKKLFLALLLAVGVQLAGPPTGWAGDKAFQRQEPKGAHKKGARGSTKNKHQAANARRASEQAAAAARRELTVKKAALRRQQSAKQAKAAAKKQGGRGGRR